MPVFFLTDILLFLLMVMVVVFIIYARRHEHLREPWRQVFRKPLALISVVILAFFVMLGLLDSMHFHPRLDAEQASETQYSTEVLSLLDAGLAHLRNNTEKTYSAPFATHSFARETIETEDGKKIRLEPKLAHGGSHLENAEDRISDILLRTVFSLLIAFILWSLISLLLVVIISKQNKKSVADNIKAIFRNNLEVPWHIIFLTLAALIYCGTWCFYLSHYYHIFGTDKVGQDVFFQAIKGIRTGLVIGTLTTLVMLPFALLLGIMAGYFRGWIDDVIQYLYTTLNSIPGVLLIAASILMLEVYMANHADDFTSTAHRADLRLLFLCIILGITNWTGLCRMLRGEAMKLREIDYVQAAQAFGVSHFTIMMRHLLPNVMHIVMISIVLDFSGLVLAEAVLAYINIGVDPSMSSWGNMINSARLEMAREPVVWWSLAAAFIFMLVLVLAANLFSDAVRDAFDPRIRNER